MIIEKICIKSFGMLTDVTLEFSSGINVIEGQNEAGKSTIAAFIKYMLYGFDNNEVCGTISERTRRLNWETGTAGGSMHVSVKGKRYLIQRSTVVADLTAQKPSYKEECSITDLETGSPAFGRIPAGEVFFGAPRELYENTAFIGQVGDAAIDAESVNEAIENILFSGSERVNNQRAAAKVSVKMENLLHKNGMGGAIYDLMRRSDDYEEKFKRADADNREILAKEAKLHEIKHTRDEEADRLERLRDLDLCCRNMVIINDFDRLHGLEEKFNEKSEEHRAFVEANMKAGFVPTQQYLTDIAVARRGVDDAYHALVEADRIYTDEKNAIGITKEIESAITLCDSLGGEEIIGKTAEAVRGSQIKNVASLIGSLLVTVASVVFEMVATGTLAQMIIRIAVAILGILGLSCAVTSALFFFKNKKRLSELTAKLSTQSLAELKAKLEVIAAARAKRDGMIRSTENARLALLRAREKYEGAKGELLEVILRWGAEPPQSGLGAFLDSLENSVREYLDSERQILDEKREIEAQMRALRSALSDKSEIDIRAQVPPFKRKVLEKINHSEILEEIEDCKVKIQAEEELAEEVERELQILKLRATEPGTLYAKMQANDARINELKEQHKAYYVALKAIEAASDNLREEISPRLGTYATELMEIMTDKKYSGFEVSDGLKVSFADSVGKMKSIDFLSGGTRDLAYVAVRLALIDMLYTEKPPICFDESFAHQDNIRAKSMMRAIRHLADEGHQSFIFTCRARESQLAKEMSRTSEVFKLSRNPDAVL